MENEVKLLLNTNLYEDILRVTDSDINLNILKNKTVLITGAGELAGFYITCALLISNDLYSTDIKVVAVDNNEDIFKKYGKLTYREDLDFIVSENFSNLSGTKADYIIHTKKPESDKEITNILELIKENNSHAVICSDCEIYGDVFNGKDKISETDTGYCDSFSPESASIQLSRILESAASSMIKEYGLEIKFSRISNIYGALESGKNSAFIKTVNHIIEKSNIEIDKKDGVPESFIYVTDAASALLKILIDGSSGEVYNTASSGISSTHITAQYCVKLFEDLGIEIIYKDKPMQLSPMAPVPKILDISKLKKLGFSPSVDLKDSIVTTAKILYEMKN